MLKKIVVLCILVMLLSTVAVAAPSKGNFVITVPMITAQGLIGIGDAFSGYSFGDGGYISFFGTGQFNLDLGWPAMFGAPWSLGYFVVNNLELGLNIGLLKHLASGGDSIINLGFYVAYYLNVGKLMPFLRVGLTQMDMSESLGSSFTMINSSIGLAFAVSKTVAPYLSLDFATKVDTGTLMNVTLGVKFMF